MINTKNIILNPYIRDDIFKFNWSRHESIKYNKLKYISKPYTIDDLYLALQYDSYELVVEFLDKLIFNDKIDVTIINDCHSLRTFKHVYNFFTLIYDVDQITSFLRTEIYVSKGITDIINFIYDEGYTINVTDINHENMFKLVVDKCKVDYKAITMDCFGPKVLIYMYEQELIDYDLSDAIISGNIDMIDYFLDEIEVVPTTEQVCELIRINYEHMDLLRDINSSSDDIAMNLIENGNMDMIESILIAGFDRELLIHYCIDSGYEDLEEILYNY